MKRRAGVSETRADNRCHGRTGIDGEHRVRQGQGDRFIGWRVAGPGAAALRLAAAPAAPTFRPIDPATTEFSFERG